SKADYERAADISRKFSGKVFRDRVQANWLPGNTSLWYEVKTGAETKEFVSMNAITGERKVLERAPVEAKREAANAGESPRASRRTGSDTSLTFFNRTAGEVEIFWLSTDSNRVSYGKLAPGAQREQHTFAGHAWVAVDTAGKTVASFEASERGTEAVISGSSAANSSTNRTGRARGNFGGTTGNGN